MTGILRYRVRRDLFVTAVQILLETDGLRYQKWGHDQVGKSGDWLVNNRGDVYTVDKDSFAKTYEQASPGVYVKTAKVWASQAAEDGVVATKEGQTAYKAGDFLVANNEDGTDAYAVSAEKFRGQYEIDA